MNLGGAAFAVAIIHLDNFSKRLDLSEPAGTGLVIAEHVQRMLAIVEPLLADNRTRLLVGLSKFVLKHFSVRAALKFAVETFKAFLTHTHLHLLILENIAG